MSELRNISFGEFSVRLAEPHELAIAANLDRLAFAPRHDPATIEKDWYDGQVQRPGRSLFLCEKLSEKTAATGTAPAACYVQIDLNLWFTEQQIPTLGIGGVAVAPHCRGQGIARQMMRHAIHSAQTQHYPLVMLYPFQHGFYRTLGWAWTGETRQYRVSTRDLPQFAERQYVVPFDPAAHSAFLQMAYYQAAIAHNGWLQRQDWQWENHLKLAPGQEIYVYAESGIVQGYIILQYKKLVKDAVVGNAVRWAIAVEEWVANTPAAYRGLIGFLAALRDQIATIIWNTDTRDAFPHLLSEPRRDPHLPTELLDFGFNHALGTIGSGFMWRIVDLNRAMELRAIAPGPPFTLSFAVDDPVLGAQAIAITFADQRMHIATQPSDTVISLSIEQLTLLWSGVRQSTDLAAFGAITLTGNPTLLTQLDAAWRTQPPFCWDFF